MIRICVICGKEFKCSPSDKKVACSKECSRINKSRTHQGKKNTWSEESKEKLRQKGKTENLKKGTEAAQRSPKSGRFETNINAKIWKLTSPDGKIYVVKNLSNWARTNCTLFGFEENEASARKVTAGLKHAKLGAEGKEYARTSLYKGWKSESATERDYTFYKYKAADLSALTEKQRICFVPWINGISVSEIAEKNKLKRNAVYARLRAAIRILDGLPAQTDSQKRYAQKYYQEHKESIKARTSDYYKTHPEKAKEMRDKWYQEHKDEVSEARREYSRKYYQENREKVLKRVNEYRKQKMDIKEQNSPGE